MKLQLSRRKQEKARIHNRPRPLWLRQIAVGSGIAVLFGLLFTGIWYGTRIEALTLSKISVTGGKTINHEEIEKIVAEGLTGSYYRLVPKHFAWTYPDAFLEYRISRVPRVKHVVIERVSGTELAVIFEEYVPYALWCSNLDNFNCVFLDHTGYAFAAAPSLSGGALLRYLVSEREALVGETPFTRELMRRTGDFVATTYQELDFNIIAVEQTAPMELAYHLAGGGTIRTSLDLSLEDTLKNLATIVQSHEFSHLKPGNFQYIDLRFGNKVFVNEEKEIAPAPVSEEATSSRNATSDDDPSSILR